MENKENTQPKFTPGPWKAHGTSQQDFVTTAWEAKGGPDSPPTPEYICKCGNDNGFYNAALISAAPEMYAILERLGQLGEKAKTFPMLALEKTLFDIIEEARRILAKARWEEKR